MAKRRKEIDEDDTFLYRYPLSYASSTAGSSTVSGGSGGGRGGVSGGGGGGGSGGGGAGGSGGLAPSKSTVYISNLDFSLTNSDLHQLFSTFGRVARVTVLKDRDSRLSKGVAFVLFISLQDACKAAKEMNGKILNGRKITASIASDNGRAKEFIRRREYKDKSRCYECGELGHLSYDCPKNQLGPREKPVPSKRSRHDTSQSKGDVDGDGDRDDTAIFEMDDWASVVDTREKEEIAKELKFEGEKVKKREKKASYFSDESDEDA